MFWIIVTIILALWMLSIIANVGGGLTYLLLAAVVILLLMRILVNRHTAV